VASGLTPDCWSGVVGDESLAAHIIGREAQRDHGDEEAAQPNVELTLLDGGAYELLATSTSLFSLGLAPGAGRFGQLPHSSFRRGMRWPGRQDRTAAGESTTSAPTPTPFV
jgi:hypothetical protein